MSATQDQPDEKPHYQDAYPAEAATPQDDDGEVQQAIQVTNPYMEKYMHYKISEPYRYFLLMVGCCGCFLASFSYSFALYAGNMMVDAHLDMAKMATISTVMLVFSYFTLPYAFIYDAFGPTPVLVAGTILLPLGSLLMALTFDGHIKATTATYSVFLGILGGGCIIFDLATVVSVLSWFPINRGPVVAIMKSFAGLGLAILGTIQLAFFEVQPASFFYFMMALALFLGLTCIAFMRLPPYHLTSNMVKTLSDDEKAARHLTKELFLSQKATPWRMYYALGVVIFLIIFLPLQSLLIVYDDLSRKYKIAFCFVVIAGLLAYSFSCIPIHLFGENSGLEDEEGLDAEQALEAEDMPHACVVGDEAEEEAELVHDLEHLAPQFQSTFLEGLRTIRLWGIFVCCFAVIGAQLVILFNYTYIVAAIRKELTDSKFKTLLTTMSGVGSAVGRLLLAWFEVWSQNRAAEDRLPVSMCLFFPVFFTTLGLLLYVVLPGGALPVAHFIVSMGNGTAAAAAVLVFRGIFAKEPAKHYNFGFLAAMVSAIVFNRVVYAEWYVHRLGQLPLKDTMYGLVCLEKSCVLMPLLLMLGLNALSFFGAFYVNWEYSAYCRDVLASRAAALAEDPEHGHAPDSEEIDPNQKLDNVSSSNEPANA